MPENGERTSTLSDMVDQGSTAYPRIWLGQGEPPRKEQRSVLNVEGELEEGRRVQRTKRLGCAAAVPDGLVVANARVVRVTRLLQDRKRVLTA